jgi:outer membrane protein TolC
LGAALPNVSASAFTRKDLLRGRICDPNSLVCVTDEAVYGGSISITQPLIAPATWVAVRASSYGLEAREHAAADMQRTLAMQMVDAIAAVLTQERLISTARTALRATIERARLVKTGMKLGSLTSLDVLRAEQDVALVQKIVLDFRSALSQAQEDLGAVLGQAHPVGVSDAFRLNSVAAGCQPRVADRRHDILAAQLRADASRTELKQIRMQFLPSLNFIASFNLSSVPYADDRHRAFVVGGDLTFPLFDGGVRYGQLRTAEAAAAQADERAKSVASTARLESVRAERKVAAARDALEVTKRAFSLAVETERLARAAISVGSGTVLELIDAGRRLRESEAAVVVNETEFLAASVQEALVAGECQW